MSKKLLITLILFSSISVFGQNEEEIFTITEIPPSFPGGVQGFYNYLYKNLKPPKDNKISGQVIIQFIVEKDGELTNEKVVKSLNEELDAEALRVMQISPNWIPGRAKKGGETVRVKMVQPIRFIVF